MANPHDSQYAPSRTYRYWCLLPDDVGLLFFRCAADRDTAVALMLQRYREDDDWPDGVDEICAGEVTLIATEVDRIDRPAAREIDAVGCDAAGHFWPDGCAYRCDYVLRPLAPPGPEEDRV